jgi:hypothetical protein
LRQPCRKAWPVFRITNRQTLILFGVSLATLPVRTMLFVLIDYDESRRNAQYCAFYVLQMIELMRVRYKKITDS